MLRALLGAVAVVAGAQATVDDQDDFRGVELIGMSIEFRFRFRFGNIYIYRHI